MSLCAYDLVEESQLKCVDNEAKKSLGKKNKFCVFLKFRQVWYYLHFQLDDLIKDFAKKSRNLSENLDLTLGQSHTGFFSIGLSSMDI